MVPESDLAALDALDEIVAGNKEYRREIVRKRREMLEVMELERIYRMPVPRSPVSKGRDRED